MKDERMHILPESEEQMFVVVASSKNGMPILDIMNITNTRFKKDRKIQTVATILHRLEEKKFLSSYKVNRYKYYRTEVNLDEYKKMKIEKIKNLLFDGKKEELIRYIENCDVE